MNEFNRSNGSGFASILFSLPAFFLAAFLVWKVYWMLGFGPWDFDNPDHIQQAHQAFFVYLIHFVRPGFSGDVGLESLTWYQIEDRLRAMHGTDAFLGSVWVPLSSGLIISLLTCFGLYKFFNRPDPGYIRGSRIRK